jgi:hypothetical protein
MRIFNVKFALVSTYEKTVFLKIDRRTSKPEEYGLYYSEIIHDYDTMKLNNAGNPETVGTRSCLLYVLHRAADSNERNWNFNGNDIQEAQWYSILASNESPAPEGTPHKDLAARLLLRHYRLRNTTSTNTTNAAERAHIVDQQKEARMIVTRYEAEEEENAENTEMSEVAQECSKAGVNVKRMAQLFSRRPAKTSRVMEPLRTPSSVTDTDPDYTPSTISEESDPPDGIFGTAPSDGTGFCVGTTLSDLTSGISAIDLGDRMRRHDIRSQANHNGNFGGEKTPTQ